MIQNPLTTPPFAGGKDLWADVDFSSMPPQTRRLVERAKFGDDVRLADQAATTAALAAQLLRATAIAIELETLLVQKATK